MSAETQAALPDAPTWEPAAKLREISIRALGRMYLPQDGLFSFRIRRDRGRVIVEGRSTRYTAIVLIGLAREGPETASAVLAGQNPGEVCRRLLDAVDRSQDLGEVALALWAARALRIPDFERPLQRLKQLKPSEGAFPTVELSWSLTSLAFPGLELSEEGFAKEIAGRLLASFQEPSGLFPHWPRGPRRSSPRSHVACFADLVYPIQALSHYHQQTGSREALEVAGRCGRVLSSLQGPQGQWWWHYDVRTGRVVERYPVYSVHQDAMAPMALFALHGAGGPDHSPAIRRGLDWLSNPPEIGLSLIDEEAGVIWRKVARREPGKLSRSLQAFASYLWRDFRFPVDLAFPPVKVDFECRPYHLGWILHAWPLERLAAPREASVAPKVAEVGHLSSPRTGAKRRATQGD